jgi:hypothetical protein
MRIGTPGTVCTPSRKGNQPPGLRGSRIETINTLEAYLGSLPGHGVENVRRPLINTMNLADLLPTSTIWTGSASAPCPMYPPLSPALMHCVTHGATPFRLNLHVRDLGHTFMFGPTGAGKSTHLGIIAAQLRRYAGMSIYAFDKGMSMYPLAAQARPRRARLACISRWPPTMTAWPSARSSSSKRRGIGPGRWSGSTPSWR